MYYRRPLWSMCVRLWNHFLYIAIHVERSGNDRYSHIHVRLPIGCCLDEAGLTYILYKINRTFECFTIITLYTRYNGRFSLSFTDTTSKILSKQKIKYRIIYLPASRTAQLIVNRQLHIAAGSPHRGRYQSRQSGSRPSSFGFRPASYSSKVSA